MAAGYWTTTRPNGQPVQDGTVCWVTEVDGINPIYTYGKNEQEVIEKLSLNQAHAQAALARRSVPLPDAAAPAPQPRRRMSADEVMQATVDLSNPAKVGSALTRLVADTTGVDLARIALENYGKMAMDWQTTHPEFYPHPGNKRLLTEQARLEAGGELTAVTPEILTHAFNVLQRRGELYPVPATPPASSEPEGSNPTPPNNLHSFPGESPVQRTERPRGAQFATGTRSTSFRGGNTAPPKTLKYTAEEIRTMPEAKMRRLIEINDRDYAQACEVYFGQASA